MTIALPDELELRKVFSPRTIAWLRQISQISGIEASGQEAENMAMAISSRPNAAQAAQIAELKQEIAGQRRLIASLREKVDNLEKVTG